MTQIFVSFLLTSGVGTILALLLVALRPVTRKRFSAGWHYYMWLVVLFVMICPVKFTLPAKTAIDPVAVSEEHVPTQAPESPIVTEFPAEEGTPAEQMAIHPQEKGTETANIVLQDLAKPMAYIWLLGAVLMFAVKMMNYGWFLIKIRRRSERVSCPALSDLTDRAITTRVSDDIGSPLVIGLFKPTLLLPKADLTPEQRHNVLAHEVTHLVRGDILYKWFVSVVKCIHWFNPAIYFISRQVSVDCEIACDAAVTKQMDEQEKKGYVETILSLLSHNNQRAVPLTTGMTGDKKTLKKRFSMLKNKLKISKKTVVISVVVAVVLLAGAIVGSGLLGGSLLPVSNDELLQVNTDARQGDNFNVLLLGLDKGGRADTIMLLMCKGGHVTGMSIPRDAVFKATGTDSLQRISEILAEENGDQKVIDTVKTQLSIPITYYAKINLSAVQEIVDGLGGVEFDVPTGMIYDDPAQDLHIDLEPGVRVLSGEEVCGLLRYRGSNDGRAYPRGDLDRIALGQSLIKEFIKQKSTPESLKKLPEIFRKTKENIQTNYPLKTLLSDLKNLKQSDDGISFNYYTAPGVLKTETGASVIYDLETGDVVSIESLPSFQSVWPENEMAKIKSLAKATEPYPGFEHITLDGTTGSQIEGILSESGLTVMQSSFVDLQKNYAVRPYEAESTKVLADKNGNISLYLPGYEQNYDVTIYNEKTHEEVGGFGVLGNNTSAYTFLGFEEGVPYSIQVKSQTAGDWVQSGSYLIY